MMSLASEVIRALTGRTLVTAESLTGGGIGAALTEVPGSSAVYKGGVICYTNWVKERILGVSGETLESQGAVSAQTAREMAGGVRALLQADIAIAVTGLAGPTGDDFGNPVGTVFIGYQDAQKSVVKACLFSGDRESIRRQTQKAALSLVMENL